ncbi:uncharacterized protein A4U43_C01F21870 [Asparagus officinalis]|uniref:Uncharacterized protein n=1 Tax=Asparagus officinalis TaxID=4686 RepID=A0A5P1FUV3_ASPOF|nr:probable rRNA-processing protein EBP2 homolog [Asparagus officinalis]XP_020249707.1 probable rRNA-processing protein EBP2 homolog [Asparagus officinalis]ONK80799.1 uncharacterized protein A4U43_C01F21870 [Asparagus officinalis]
MGMLKKPQLSFLEAATMEDTIADVDEEMMDSGSESEDEEVALTEPSKTAIHNKEGLLEKLEDIAWPENADWIHKLSINYDLPAEIDVNDDLAREMAFYTQALDATRQAFEKLQAMGLPFLRPPDYYAEMVKSDSHMLKIKGKLLVEKKKIEEAEERKKARESKKIAKEVQAQKNKERVKRKKEDIESVKKWRKQRQQSGFAKGKGEEMDFDLDGENKFGSKKRRPGAAPGDRSGGVRRHGNNKKREKRESKFGHGGRKGMKKQNTADTTNDLRGFNKGEFPGNNKRRKG